MENTSDKKQRLFVDIDGTLAVFKPVDTLETLYEEGYFLNLPPHDNVIEAVQKIIKENEDIEVFIMSAVLTDSKYALKEKNEWIDKYLPQVDKEHRIFPPCGEDKKEYIPDGVRQNDFLLDDYTHNLTLWQPPARGIKLLNGINHTNGTWQYDRLDYRKNGEVLAENVVSIMKNEEIIKDVLPREVSDMKNENYYAILQSAEREILFQSLGTLEKSGIIPTGNNYEIVHLKNLEENTMPSCEDLFVEFNSDKPRPADFYGHSLSISDVIIFNHEGKTEAFYCDKFNFIKLDDGFMTEKIRKRLDYGLDIRKEYDMLHNDNSDFTIMEENYDSKERKERLSEYEASFDLADKRGIILNNQDKLRIIREYELKGGEAFANGITEQDIGKDLIYIKNTLVRDNSVEKLNNLLEEKYSIAMDKNLGISFLVAESMEFHTLGMTYENISTIEEAIRLYKTLPEHTKVMGNGISIVVDDLEYPILEFGEISDLEYCPQEIKESFTVRNAINILKKEFEIVEPTLGEKEQGVDITMPDETLGIWEMNDYGYSWEGMLPLGRGKALELFNDDVPVYLLYHDNSESTVGERKQILEHDGIYGIEKEDWERYLERKEVEQAVIEEVQAEIEVEQPFDNTESREVTHDIQISDLVTFAKNNLKEEKIGNFEDLQRYEQFVFNADVPFPEVDEKFNNARSLAIELNQWAYKNHSYPSNEEELFDAIITDTVDILNGDLENIKDYIEDTELSYEESLSAEEKATLNQFKERLEPFEKLVNISNFEYDKEDGYLYFTVEADGYQLDGVYRVYDPKNGKDMSLVSIDYGYDHPIIKKQWDRIEAFLQEYTRERYREIMEEKNKDMAKFVQSHAELLKSKAGDRKTVVINAFGGPGCGKSTACLQITEELKKAGYVAEYVQEYAKDLVWEENWEMLNGTEAHQFEILQEQLKRMDRLYGKVDFVVTDAPILLNSVYNNELTSDYEQMLSQLYSQYTSFNFVVERDVSEFEEEGRIHNLEESIEKDGQIKTLIDKNNLYYGIYNHSTITKIVKNAITHLSKLYDKEQNKDMAKEENNRDWKYDERGFQKSELTDMAQVIGKYEDENHIPQEESVVTWFGDRALYEIRTDVTEEMFQKAYEKATLVTLREEEVEKNNIEEAGKSVEELKNEALYRGVVNVMDSKEFKNYCDTMNKLMYNNYSAQNCGKILNQWIYRYCEKQGIDITKLSAKEMGEKISEALQSNEKPTYLMGYEGWKQYGRQVQGHNVAYVITAPNYVSEYGGKGSLLKAIKKSFDKQFAEKENLEYATFKLGVTGLSFYGYKNGLIDIVMHDNVIRGKQTEELVRRFLDTEVIGKMPNGYSSSYVYDVKNTVEPEFLWVKSGYAKNELVLDDNGNPVTRKPSKKTNTVEYKIINSEERRSKFNPNLALDIKELDENKMNTLFAVLQEVSNSKGVPMTVEAIEEEGTKGFFSQTNNRIVIKDTLSATEKCAVAFHEMAHADMHYQRKDLSREMKEVQAEAVAYMTAQNFGIETSTSSFNYIAAWSKGRDVKELENSMNDILKQSKKLFKEISAELGKQGLDLSLEPIDKESEKVVDKTADISEFIKSNKEFVLTEIASVKEIKTVAKEMLKETSDERCANIFKEQIDLCAKETRKLNNIDKLLNELEMSNEPENLMDKINKEYGKICGMKEEFTALSEEYIDRQQELKTLKSMSLKERYKIEPIETMKEYINGSDNKKLKELTSQDLDYIAKSKYISDTFGRDIKTDISDFMNQAVEQLENAKQVKAKNGSFVEIAFCEQWTEKPIFEKGTVAHPKTANQIIGNAEKEIRALKQEAEKNDDYFPYSKCHVTLYTEDNGKLMATQTRIDIGDGTQKNLSDHLKQCGCNEQVLQAYSMAVKENVKNKMLEPKTITEEVLPQKEVSVKEPQKEKTTMGIKELKESVSQAQEGEEPAQQKTHEKQKEHTQERV